MVYRGDTGDMNNMDLENLEVDNLTVESVSSEDLTASDDLTVGDDALISGDLTVTGTSVLTGAVTATAGIQAGAVAVTAGATAVAIPAGTTFASVTSANATHIVKLPTPVLGNILYIKETGTTGFEIMPQANTQYINGTLCDVAKSLAMAANTGVAVFICVVGGANGKWVQYWIDDDGTIDAGGIPD